MLVYHRVTAGSPQKTSHFGKGRSTSKPPWLERFNYCNFPGCYRYITMAPSQSIRCLESLMKSQAFLFTSFSTSGTTALDDFHHISLFRAKMFTDLKYHYSQLKLLQFLLISKQQSSSSYYFLLPWWFFYTPENWRLEHTGGLHHWLPSNHSIQDILRSRWCTTSINSWIGKETWEMRMYSSSEHYHKRCIFQLLCI